MIFVKSWPKIREKLDTPLKVGQINFLNLSIMKKIIFMFVGIVMLASCASDDEKQLDNHLSYKENPKDQKNDYEFSDVKNNDKQVASNSYATQGCIVDDKQGARCVASFNSDCDKIRDCNAFPDGIMPVASDIAVVLGIPVDDVLGDWEGALSPDNMADYPELSEIIHQYMDWEED